MESARPRSSGFVAPRRVFTAPAPPSAPQPAVPPQSSGELVDTLYDHPNVKIIAFTAGRAGPDIEPGSLPWSSQLERTLAVGPFRIYRAPGSVAFLSCGSALQPILPKSQVWCVDEESSKFILQIRRPQYWRIEVPIGDDEEVRWAQQLREVFDAILQFEKTECPFNRPFTVELPERPETRILPWDPTRRSSASLPMTSITPEIARLHEGTPRGSICVGDLRTVFETRRALNEHAKSLLLPKWESMTAESRHAWDGQGNDGSSSSLFLPRVERPRSVSAVPPQRPLFMGGALPKIREAAPPTDRAAEAPRFTSPTESLESIRGRESWLPTPLPPSPPLSTPGSPRSSSQQFQTPHVPRGANTTQDTLGQPVIFKTSQIWGAATTDSLPTSEPSATTTATPIHEPDCPTTSAQQQPAGTTQPAVATPTTSGPETPFKTASSTPVPTTPSPSSPSSRGRRPPSAAQQQPPPSPPLSPPRPPRTAPSPPLPPAANLLTTRRQPPPRAAAAAAMPVPVSVPAASTPVMQNALAAVRRLPMTVLHKTCAILFSPPSYLISLMLKVAARIMAGEWRGLVFGLGEGGERVSVAWDWSDDDEDHGRGGGGGGGGGGDSGLGARGRGWNGSGGDGDGDDFWLRGRTGPGKAKMVGAFPDSDDEDYHEDEAVGPLDRSVVVSPGRKNRGVVSGKAGVVVEQKAVGRLRGKHGKESDSESGVD